MLDLAVAIDPGSSLTKVIYLLWPEGKPEVLLMLPEVIQIQSADLTDLGLSGGNPENDAFLKLADGRFFALGLKAQQLRGTVKMSLVKYELAVYKVLAVIGAIAQKASLPNQFSVALEIVLPYSEYQDSARLQQLIKENLADFGFRGQRFSIALELSGVKPEGAGLAQGRRKQLGPAWMQRNSEVFMWGHRNLSLFQFHQGTPARGNTCDLGFNRMVTDIAQRAALHTSQELQMKLPELIFKARTRPQIVAKLAGLVVSSDEERQCKIQQIKEAITAGEQKYWQDVKGWLQESLRSDWLNLDEVVVCGGGSAYFKLKLLEFFYDQEISWSAGLDDTVQSLFRFKNDGFLALRMSDVFGVFKVLEEKVKSWEPALV